MRKGKLISLALASAVAISGCTLQTTEETEPSETGEVLEEAQDISAIRAQDDFYGYINAQYLYDADITLADGNAGSFTDLQLMLDDQLEQIIHEIVDGNRDSYAPGSNEQLIYDAYYQLLDASTGGYFMNDEDIAYMNDVADQILGTQTIDEYLDVCGMLYSEWGVNPLFGGRIDTSLANSSAGSINIVPFTSPTGDSLELIINGGYYAQSIATRMKSLLIDFGMDEAGADERSLGDASLIMDIANGTDLELVKIISEDWGESMKLSLYRTNEELDELCPNIGSEGIMRTMGLTDNPADGVYLWEEGQLQTIDSLLIEENLEAWQDIALLSFINSFSSMLPEEYGGTELLFSNDRYALDTIMTQFQDQLGEEYAERYYDEETVEDVTAITHALVDEYIVIINECEWLSDEGKAAIINKLNNMEFYIGADEPHEVDPEDEHIIGHSAFDTLHNLNIRQYEKDMDKLINGIERNGFEGMPPQIVNACYLPDMNAINITLAIMNDPFYSSDNTYWQNLGGIGSVVGHEISHAFDNHGMLFDMNGNYNPEWMPQEDREAFDQMADLVSQYYSEQTVLDIHPVDGELTLGENLADISGLECVLRQASNNEQRQEIFESYARIWASVMPKNNALDYLYLDVHSPDRIRVNAVVPLFDSFYEIYGVEEGDGMYVAPEDRITRW